MPETRAPARKLMDAIITVIGTATVGPNAVAVGDGGDPNHEPPYLVVKRATSFNFEGPFDNPDADEEVRVMVIGVGDTREQADGARDIARAVMTKANLTKELAKSNRSCMSLFLDLSYDQRFDRGRATPRFSAVDQYLVTHTPVTEPTFGFDRGFDSGFDIRP